jgi:hypothetical protein
MGEWSANNQADRATAVWDRLLGLFGEALLRKFGAEHPQEWETGIGYLTDAQVDRGFRRLVFGWKGAPPSLPEFVRVCRSIGDEDIDEGPQPLALPNPDKFQCDGWDIAGNMRLLKHITTTLAAKSDALGQVPEMQREYRHGKFFRLLSVPSPQQVQTTAILVAYKKAWSQDMREWGVDAETGELLKPTLAQQDEAWSSCMERAMIEIKQFLGD